MRPDQLVRIPAAAESALPGALIRHLPDTTPPAPWECDVEAVVWAHRPSGNHPDMAGGAVRGRGPPRLVVGGFLRCGDTPVGEYAEVFGAVVLANPRPVLHVPFMAVDSLASLRGGRDNWALPKTLATLTGRPRDGGLLSAEADGWRVAARVRRRRPALPAAATLSFLQPWPDGPQRHFRATLTGRARPARVDVDVASDGALARWLSPGRHFAVAWPSARLRVHLPRRG